MKKTQAEKGEKNIPPPCESGARVYSRVIKGDQLKGTTEPPKAGGWLRRRGALGNPSDDNKPIQKGSARP